MRRCKAVTSVIVLSFLLIAANAHADWVQLANMGVGRTYHTATLLNNGKVLVTGGSSGGTLNSPEIYDPSTNTWQFAAPMGSARSLHSATLMQNGKVLVAGGSGSIRH